MKLIPIAAVAAVAVAVVGALLFNNSRSPDPAAPAVSKPNVAEPNSAGTDAPSDQAPRVGADTDRDSHEHARTEPVAEALYFEHSSLGDKPATKPMPPAQGGDVDRSELITLAVDDPVAFDEKSRDWGQPELKSNYEALFAVLQQQVSGEVPEGERVLKPEQITLLEETLTALERRIKD